MVVTAGFLAWNIVQQLAINNHQVEILLIGENVNDLNGSINTLRTELPFRSYVVARQNRSAPLNISFGGTLDEGDPEWVSGHMMICANDWQILDSPNFLRNSTGQSLILGPVEGHDASGSYIVDWVATATVVGVGGGAIDTIQFGVGINELYPLMSMAELIIDDIAIKDPYHIYSIAGIARIDLQVGDQVTLWTRRVGGRNAGTTTTLHAQTIRIIRISD